jgi:uncharacterized membrane protein YqgA involved in biofilm formation
MLVVLNSDNAMPGTGTLINIMTVLIGSSLGLLLRSRLNERYKVVILQGVGILTMVIGMQMALKTDNILILLISMILGGLSGQLLKLEDRLDLFADQVKKKFAKKDDAFFSEGFITASIIFCVGPMTILGSFNDGLRGDINLLAIKSVLDGFTALALTTTFGIGVIFSVFTIIVVQGGLTFSALLLDQFLNEMMINEMTAVGGVIIIGIGFILLEIKKIKVATFLPALIFAPIIVIIYQKLSILF